MIRLEPLSSAHAEEILHGQDEHLAAEISGRRWDAQSIAAFLSRVERWRADGPLREYAACDGSRLVGGAGAALLGAGLHHGQAALTYWVLAAYRGRGYGHLIATQVAQLTAADPRVQELVLRIDAENRPSQAVARRLGAQRTGRWARHPGDHTRRVEVWTLPAQEVAAQLPCSS